MRIAIPTDGQQGMEDSISNHFGRCPTFTIYDTDTKEVEVILNTSEHMGGSGKPPELLSQQHIDVMITSNLGRRAVTMFKEFGIQVYCGARGTAKDAVESWRRGELAAADENNVCEEGH
ncbi:MAG: NifB/NifX family molybdenum-iron cluster-binding protein [Thermoplasmata archaeon]